MTRHLGPHVSAYVDRRLDASALRAFDQHLVVCLVCSHAADQERRLLASLRSGATPGFSADLHSMLLALAQPPGDAEGQAHIGSVRMPARVPLASPASDTAPGSPLHGSSPASRGPAGFSVSTTPSGVPPIPRAPDSVRQLRVRTVPPTAPALHRSPRRAAMVAGLAAGASAAAAIGLAVVGPGTGAAAATLRPADTRSPGSSSVNVSVALFNGGSTGFTPARPVLGRPGR